MKVLLLVLLIACRSNNDAAILEHEAFDLAKYYWPKVELLEQRVQTVYKRAQTIPDTAPGMADVGKRWGDARDAVVQLKGVVAPGPDGKSAVEKQAAAAAKNANVAELQKLVHDTEVTLERGLTVINDNIAAVESWIADYERVASAEPAKKTGETVSPTQTPTSRQPAAPTTPTPTPQTTQAPSTPPKK